MKNKLISILAALFITLPSAFAQTTNTAFSGVSLISSVSATLTQSSGIVKLPTFSGSGTLTITESGVTGSPSGCTVGLAYQGNNASTVGATVSTTSFTPATGVQTFSVTPTVLTGDAYVATYACSTYPTSGLITISFSPVQVTALDPCFVSPKSSVSVAISTATTTQLVALAAGKKVYVCGFTASVGATTTVSFEYGTGTACATGTTALTGVFAPSTGAVLSLSGDGTRITAPAGNALCAVTTGTGGVNGFLTVIQQ